MWPAWRQALVIVAPATVLRWQRRRFRRHWATLSGRAPAGRPPVDAAIQALVRRMAAANPLWGAPRIHGELLKLGIDVAEHEHLDRSLCGRVGHEAGRHGTLAYARADHDDAAA
jgi:hypothetical protein